MVVGGWAENRVGQGRSRGGWPLGFLQAVQI